jgi:hypothetical protein
MNLKLQMPALNQFEENVRVLKGLISRFNQSSLELIREYRRLEERAGYLKGQRESVREPCCRDRKISTAIRQHQANGKRENRSFVSPVLDVLMVVILTPLTLALLLEARHSRGNCCASHAPQESQAGREG